MNRFQYPNILLKTKRILKELGCGIIKRDNKHFIFLHELIYRHHRYKEKVGKGVKYFRIKMTKIDNTEFELQIRRKRNPEEIEEYGKYKYESFDWKYCATGFKKSDLAVASTRVIALYRFTFKIKNKDENGNWTCKYCNKITNNTKEIHTDHIYPQCELLKDFCRNRNDIPTKFDKEKYTNETKFRNEDFNFHKEWVDYHNKNVKFQLLCKECNLKKGTKIIVPISKAIQNKVPI